MLPRVEQFIKERHLVGVTAATVEGYRGSSSAICPQNTPHKPSCKEWL